MLGHPIVFLRVSDAPCVLSSLFAPCFLVLDDSREPTDEALRAFFISAARFRVQDSRSTLRALPASPPKSSTRLCTLSVFSTGVFGLSPTVLRNPLSDAATESGSDGHVVPWACASPGASQLLVRGSQMT